MFKNNIYIASNEYIYRLNIDDNKLTLIDTKINNCTYGKLYASDNTLFSIGRKHVLYSEDGVKWNDITP